MGIDNSQTKIKGGKMDSTFLTTALQAVLQIVIPYIKKLIESKVVPTIKRKVYERLDGKADALIKDLAQNASKIANEQNEIKKAAYIEGTKLGLETLRAISEKLNKAADEIERVL